MVRHPLFIAVFGWLSLVAFAHADEAALYDAPLPDDAAFVRFLGFPEDAAVTVFDLTVSGERVTDGRYSVLQADAIDGLERGAIFTAVPAPDGTPLLLSEPARSERKVLLRLINLSPDGPVALKTADGSVDIIAATAPLALGAREVNPIQVSVAVFDGDAAVGDVIPLVLRANGHLTFVVAADGTVAMLEDDINPDPMR